MRRIALLLVMALLVGCIPMNRKGPIWAPRWYWKPPRGCGAGSAPYLGMLNTTRDAALSSARADLARQIHSDMHLLSRRYVSTGWSGGRKFAEGVAGRVIQEVVDVDLRYARNKKLVQQGKQMFALVCLDRGKLMRLAKKMESEVRREAALDRKLASRSVDEVALEQWYGEFAGDVAKQHARIALKHEDEPYWKLLRNEQKSLSTKGDAVIHAALTQVGELALRCEGENCPGLTTMAYTAAGFDLQGMGPVALYAFTERTGLLNRKRAPRIGDVAFITPKDASSTADRLTLGLVEALPEEGVAVVLVEGAEGLDRLHVRTTVVAEDSETAAESPATAVSAWTWRGASSLWRSRLLLKDPE